MESFSQTGGIRIGEGIFSAFNATWPFAKLIVTPQQLHLSGFSYEFSFPRASIRRLSNHKGLFSAGLRIEHGLSQYPIFLVFWTFNLSSLKTKLREMGYPIDEAIP